jgi:hypothetical protein
MPVDAVASPIDGSSYYSSPEMGNLSKQVLIPPVPKNAHGMKQDFILTQPLKQNL